MFGSDVSSVGSGKEGACLGPEADGEVERATNNVLRRTGLGEQIGLMGRRNCQERRPEAVDGRIRTARARE